MKKFVKKSVKASVNLYDELKYVIENPEDDIDIHESDIYVLKTPETTKIIQKYYDDMGIENQATQFIDSITHRRFYDIPFGYMNEYVANKKAFSNSTVHGRKITASTDLSIDEMWEYLLNIGVSEETLRVVTNINGYNEETMCDILYAVTGYHSFEQIYDE